MGVIDCALGLDDGLSHDVALAATYEARDDMAKGSSKDRFKVGDIVKLKSGGPEMTVQVLVNDYYQCQWFAGKKLESGRFPEAALEPASVKPPIPAPSGSGAGA